MIDIAGNVIGSGIVVICNGSDVIGIISDINSYNINHHSNHATHIDNTQ